MVDASAFFGVPILTAGARHEALLIEKGRVTALGQARQVRRSMPTGTEVHHLQGGLVVPGLVDAHLHLSGMAVRRFGVDLAGAASLGEVKRRLSAWADRNPSGPVVATGWDDTRLRERRLPLQAALDDAVPDRSAVAFLVSGHAAVANSVAVDACGSTPRPRVRGSDSLPRSSPGMFLEEELRWLDPITEAWLEHRPATVLAVLRDCRKVGLTHVGNMSVRPAEFAHLSDLDRSGRLPIHVDAYAQVHTWRECANGSSPAGHRLRFRGVKAQLDGALGIRTAAMIRPYADAPGSVGHLRPDLGLVESELPEIARRGLQIALHAIGDRAVEAALGMARQVSHRPTPRIEHASVLSERLVTEVAHVRPVLVVQPSFTTSDVWLPDRLGSQRLRWAYPFASLRSRGVPLAGSSDAPVESFDPWEGMRACLTPRSWSPARDPARETLTSPDALEMYTLGGARAFDDPEVGSLTVGARGDFLVLADRSLDRAIQRGVAGLRGVWMEGRQVERGPAGGRGRSPAVE